MLCANILARSASHIRIARRRRKYLIIVVSTEAAAITGHARKRHLVRPQLRGHMECRHGEPYKGDPYKGEPYIRHNHAREDPPYTYKTESTRRGEPTNGA